MPSMDKLLALGFWKGKNSKPYKTTWVKNPRCGGDSQPRLTWSRTAGGDWLNVEVSLPKYLFGRNTVWLNQKEIFYALDKLSLFVCENAKIDFNAKTALVGRLHYFKDFYVGSQNVALYLNATSKLIIPRYDRRIDAHGINFFNKSKQIVLYNKQNEVLARTSEKEANEQELSESHGVIRLEVRNQISDSCKQVAKKNDLSGRTADDLLNGAIAFQELSDALSLLGIDSQVIDCNKRIDRLREFHGDTAVFRRTVCFITLLERFGENFWRDGIGGYKRTKYLDELRLVKKANALIVSETSLPSLCLCENDFMSK